MTRRVDPATDPLRAEEQLIRENLKLVGYAVAELGARIPRHVHRDDLVSAGMAGLAQAVRSYDEARGVPFDRYARNRIKGALLDELRRADWATRSVRARARQVAQMTEVLSPTLGRAPMPVEVAGALGWDPREVITLADDVNRAVVLAFDGLTADGVDMSEVIADTAPTPDEELVERERRGYLVDSVAALPERLRQVIVGYFLEEKPMAELAKELGVTESRISQMRTEALALLRDGMDSQLDPEKVAGEDEERKAGRRGNQNSSRADGRRQAYRAAVASRSTCSERISHEGLQDLVESRA